MSLHRTISIPEMTDSLGRYWDAPSRDRISTSMSHAWMDQQDFNKLCHYQTTLPTGTYVGKMWKKLRRTRNGNVYWVLCWFDEIVDAGKTITIKYLRIGINP